MGVQGPVETSRKCGECGIVNFAHHEACRRCGAALITAGTIERPVAVRAQEPRRLGQRLAWIAGAISFLLFLCYQSLIATSEGLAPDERKLVGDAITALELSHFTNEAFVLRHLVSYRRTDNWWNGYVGHSDAYAATNFPFEVVTVYRPFFDITTDDIERAIILLHESHHLTGEGEEAALEAVWREKSRLGWDRDKYRNTTVWKNTRDWTAFRLPALFHCGANGRSDCLQ